MGDGEDTLALQVSVVVDATPAAAFDTFTTRLHLWWVREFTWSGRELLDTIGIEPGPGGKAFEIGPHGFRLDWGRVLVWDPPRRLVLAWHIAPDRVPRPDPAQASEIEAWFRPHPDGTAVTLQHRHFERHGPAAAAYRRVMTDGWRELLDRYAETCRAADTCPAPATSA